MVKVCIEKQLLPVADMLTDIFRMRMADVCACENDRTQASGNCANSDATPSEKVAQTSDVLVCSSDFVDSVGGTAGIVEQSRRIKAKKLVVVGHDQQPQAF